MENESITSSEIFKFLLEVCDVNQTKAKKYTEAFHKSRIRTVQKLRSYIESENELEDFGIIIEDHRQLIFAKL
jgi:hypothetical protein